MFQFSKIKIMRYRLAHVLHRLSNIAEIFSISSIFKNFCFFAVLNLSRKPTLHNSASGTLRIGSSARIFHELYSWGAFNFVSSFKYWIFRFVIDLGSDLTRDERTLTSLQFDTCRLRMNFGYLDKTWFLKLGNPFAKYPSGK